MSVTDSLHRGRSLANLFRRRPTRALDDSELDSGDDEGRYDRREDRMDIGDDEEGFGEVKVMDLSLGRAPAPRSTNPEVGQL